MLNIVAIHAITKPSSLPKNLKTLLLSLAVSDLGVGLLVQPLYIRVLVMRLENNIDNTTFTASFIVANLFSYASFFGVTALSADRFFAIHLHLRYQELVTYKRVVAAVISIWVFSAFLSLIRLLDPAKKESYIIFTTVELAFLIITASLYYKIYAAVRRHTNQIQALQVQQGSHNDEMANAVRLRKSAIGTFYVYLTFLVCYLPQNCLYIAVLTSQGNWVRYLSHYAVLLVFLNSSLNPLIYCWKMKSIRHAIMDVLRNIPRPIHNSEEAIRYLRHGSETAQ